VHVYFGGREKEKKQWVVEVLGMWREFFW